MCIICYHDLKVFKEGELLLVRALVLGEIWYILTDEPMHFLFQMILLILFNYSTEDLRQRVPFPQLDKNGKLI